MAWHQINDEHYLSQNLPNAPTHMCVTILWLVKVMYSVTNLQWNLGQIVDDCRLQRKVVSIRGHRGTKKLYISRWLIKASMPRGWWGIVFSRALYSLLFDRLDPQEKKAKFLLNYLGLYWWGKGWPVDGLPFPDTGCPVPDVSIYYMSNINELPDGILFHWFCKCTPPWMFLPLDIPSEYRPEHVTFGLLCVIFKFPSRIFCRRVPGFATDCPCGVWCRGLTTCLLYVGPPLEF